MLAARHMVYQDFALTQPARWSGQTRNWKPVGAVTLNPERDIIIRAAPSRSQLSGSIGEPAFPSRPGSAQAAERNAGDGRSRATRSHAQHRHRATAWARWHDRTFSAVSTVAHITDGSPHLRTSTPRYHNSILDREESLRN